MKSSSPVRLIQYMNKLQNFSIVVLIALLSSVGAQTQSGANTTKHFEKDGLSFDYPAEWSLTENRSPGLQTVTLVHEGSPTQIVVSAYRGPVPSCDFETENKKIGNALSKKVAKEIQASADPRTSPVTTQIGTTDVKGTELHGVMNRKPVIGDVYSVRMNGQFVGLVYVRSNNDESSGSAWDMIRTSLKVEAPVIGAMAVRANNVPRAPISGGVLNGKAISLPPPPYPAIARQAHASGTVVVQVVIDESGAVISAHAVSGHPLLQAVCVAAAREAHFSPTRLCGEPVKVTGVITYNFVAM